MDKRYPLKQSNLYKVGTQRKLAAALGLEENYFRKKHIYHYNEFSRKKADGKERNFSEPEAGLKKIQKKISRLLQRIDTPDWLHSGIKRKSYITNCKDHAEADYVITMDIKSFYDSVQKQYVYRLFRNKFEMPADVAGKITDLLLYQDRMPTGGAASQIVTYWAYSDMFHRIYRIAEKYSCKFSLYVDDMTFSSDFPIDFKLKEEIREELKMYGLSAKPEKDKYYRKGCPKSITGVIIDKNHNMRIPNCQRQEIMKLYAECRESGDVRRMEQLLGKYRSIKQIEAEAFPSIKNYLYANNAAIKALARQRKNKTIKR